MSDGIQVDPWWPLRGRADPAHQLFLTVRIDHGERSALIKRHNHAGEILVECWSLTVVHQRRRADRHLRKRVDFFKVPVNDKLMLRAVLSLWLLYGKRGLTELYP